MPNGFARETLADKCLFLCFSSLRLRGCELMEKHLPNRGPRPGFALIPAQAGIQYLR